MSQKDDEDKYLEFLINLGIVNRVGKDIDSGEDLYSFSNDAEEFLPGLNSMQMEDLNNAIFELWSMDLIDVAFDPNGEPLVALNENSVSSEKASSINDKDLEKTLRMIIWAFADKYNKD